jgi:phage terminase large subunit-like protein
MPLAAPRACGCGKVVASGVKCECQRKRDHERNPWFFCPENGLHEKSTNDGVPYHLWADKGPITPTPGDVVDYRAVEQKISDLCDDFDVREIAFDPWNAREMMASLLEKGLPAVEMRQGMATMAPAIHELERAIPGKRFIHSGSEILRWIFASVAVVMDDAGNKKFSKSKSTARIDGTVAAAMAVGRAHAGEGIRRSIYDSPARPDGFVIR